MSGPGAVEVRRGRTVVRSVRVDRAGAAPAADTAWSADGGTVAISDGVEVTVVTVATGATATVPCARDQVAIAGTRLRLYALTGLRSATPGLSSYDLSALPTVGPAQPFDLELGGAVPYRVDGAGEDAVVFTHGSPEAAGQGTGVFVLRQDRTAVQVAAVGELSGRTPSPEVISSAYTRSGPQNAPAFAYAPGPIGCDVQGGQGLIKDFILVFDPAAAIPQLRVFNSTASRNEAGDSYRGSWDDLWWDGQGGLNTSGVTTVCGVEPAIIDPYAQYRWDGTTWAETAATALARTIGGVTVTVTSTGLPAARRDDVRLDGAEKIAGGGRVRVDFPPPRTGDLTADDLAVAATQLAPVVRLAEGDKNMPADASTFVTSSELRFDHETCPSDEIVAHPSEVGLAAGDYVHHPTRTWCRHDQSQTYATNQQQTGVGGFYLDPPDTDEMRRGQGPTAPVYWQYVGDGAAGGAFVYWFFYSYNNFTLGDHEGDWERVAVRVAGLRPTGMTFFGHGKPSCYLPWDLLEFDGAHPVAYSARGSHASYPVAGRFPVLRVLTDRTSRGMAWPADRRLRPVDHELWWRYLGAWGGPGATASGPSGPTPVRFEEVRDRALTTRQCATKNNVVPPNLTGTWTTTPLLPAQPSTARPEQLRIVVRQGRIGETVGWVTTTGTSCTYQLVLQRLVGPGILVDQVRTGRPNRACPDRSVQVMIAPAPYGVFYESARSSAVLWPT